ncbi:MAG: cysteine desulfurase [Aigarchaeota archaeon]|nr:cysteine desulfurase [Aigarchaeota archaeon]MDW8021042.1 cysteine desulfurase family protein [Nitrososphaerota archaeon]
MIGNLSSNLRALIEAHGRPEREVYLDLENSGLIFEEALNELLKSYRESGYGHPSITHKPGWSSLELLLEAKENLLSFIKARDGEVVFTHSGTEANNLAIMGLAKATPNRRKIIISSIEHLSVKFPAERLQELGFRVMEIPVDDEGFVNLDYLSDQIDEEALMVSVAAINHEIGTVQDLRAIADVVRDKDPETIIHTDACDALGRTPLDFGKLEIDIASFSGHKIHAPKGVGALYVRDGIKLEPIIHGQLSSQSLWPGVENIPSIAGFSKAIEIFRENFDNYREKMKNLRDILIGGILSQIDDAFLNGPRGDRRAVDNVNVSFLGCEGEALTVELSLRGVYVSSGSACTSRTLEPSHVLLAIKRPYEIAHGSILMKTSPLHGEKDIEYALGQLVKAVERVRSIAPKGVV